MNWSVKQLQEILPHASRSALYRKRRNISTFGSARRPKEALKPHHRRPHFTPAMEEFLIDLLAQKGDLWQEEMISELWFQFSVLVSQQTVSNTLKRLDFTKKVAARIATQRDEGRRRQFELDLQELDEAQLVYVDESSVNEKSLFRKSAWSKKGQPAVTESVLRNSTRCSVLPAYTIDGYIPGITLVVEGSVTQAIFEHWLEHCVLPKCNPFPGRYSVVIMDNCKTHHSERVRGMFETARVRLMYLPPYSPDYNPIELTFHLLKQWLRRHRSLAPEFGCEDYKRLWTEHLLEACRLWDSTVDHRALFRKARVRIRGDS